MTALSSEALEERYDTLAPTAPVEERVDALIELAWSIALVDPARSIELTERAEKLARRSQYAKGEAYVLRNLAYYAILRGEPAEALQGALRAAKLLEAEGEPEGHATALDVQAHAYMTVGDYAAALAAVYSELEILKRCDSPILEAWALHNLGSVYLDIEDLDQAEAYYEQALERFRTLDHPSGVSRVLNRLGQLAARAGRYVEAMALHEESRQLSAHVGVQLGEAQALLDLGELMQNQGQLSPARALLEKAERIFAQTQNRQACARALLRLGQLAVQEDRSDEAERRFTAALERLGDSQAAPIELSVHQALWDVLESRGETERALFHARQVHRLSRVVNDAERRTAMRNLEVRNATENERLRYVELKEMQARLIEAEKMAVLGNLAAGLAHEANTPLGALRSSLDVAVRALERLATAHGDAAPRDRSLAAAKNALETARHAEERIGGLVASLGKFVRLDQSEASPIDVNEGIESALTLLAAQVPPGVRIERSLNPVPVVHCFGGELNQAFMTLLVNAVEAVEGNEGERIVRITTRDDGDVVVVVEDNGRGMTPELVERLFEVRFAEKGNRMRLSVGLPTAAAAIRTQGGSIDVDSRPGDGTRFEIRLPIKGCT